ncbi:hypothetical protein [uncultured Sphingomonas sp.]|uniref:hypothetical protein n=1 Tax=uncultured Sphingomonas sp. TaxID=158754 RepID=UPI0025DBE025|nr:hypothetical protein [uncultured Sphingomonas sp.]
MTPRELHLKQSFEALIEAVGGVEAAALFCRVGKSTLQTYYSKVHPKAFPPLDVIVALEPLARDRAGFPPITSILCRLNGGVFVPIPEVRATGADLWALLARKAKEGAAVSAAMCEALKDGRVDADEARRVRGEIAKLFELLALMDAELAMIEGDGA